MLERYSLRTVAGRASSKFWTVPKFESETNFWYNLSIRDGGEKAADKALKPLKYSKRRKEKNSL